MHRSIRTRAFKEKVARLESRLRGLKDDVTLLQEEQSSLSFAHDTLQHMEELLAWMQQEDQHQWLYANLPQGQQPEEQHLTSRSSINNTSTTHTGSSHAISPGIAELVSPPDDPLRQLRFSLAQPPYCPPSFAMENILQEYAADVAEIALQLYKADALQQSAHIGQVQPGIIADRPFDKVRELLQRRFWCAISLVLQRRTALLAETTLSNFAKLAEPGAQLAEPDVQRHTWAVQQIGLSQQQLARMAAASRAYRNLLAPVLDEVRQLQREIGGGGGLATPPAAEAAAAAAAAGSSSLASDDSIRQRLAAADLHQQKARRLQTLLHKDYLIKTCAAAHVYGCLTWSQLGKLLVLLAPHVASSTVVGLVVERLWHQQHQQQEHQRQQQEQQREQRQEKATKQQQRRLKACKPIHVAPPHPNIDE